MTALLSLKNVSVSRGNRVLLSGLNINIARGDLLWVRGANGSGKSTLLRTIAGLMPTSDGKVEHASPPQNSIAFLGHTNGFDRQAAVATASRFWLGPEQRKGLAGLLGTRLHRGRRMSELSAGQTRKMEILRLVSADRPLWLLDEPYASLDADSADRLTATITAHLDSDGACIIASHASLPAFGRPVRTLSIGAPA